MPSISHRASLGPGATHRAKSGLAALAAGIARAVLRSCRAWLEVGRDLHQYKAHVVHDVGFQLRTGRQSRDPARPATDLPPEPGAANRDRR